MVRVLFWKYTSVLGSRMWECRTTKETIGADDVTWPTHYARQQLNFHPEKGSMLVQITNRTGTISSIPMTEVVYLFEPDQLKPPTDCWFWDGKELNRVASCKGAPEFGSLPYKHRMAVAGSVIDQEEGPVFIINTNEEGAENVSKMKIWRFSQRAWGDEEFDSTAVALPDPQPGDPLFTGISEAALLDFTRQMKDHRKQIEEAEAALRGGDISTAAKAIRWIAKRLTGPIATGMQVTPVTGTDAPVAVISQVDTIAKMREAVKSGLTAENLNGLGNVGLGAGVADSILGSVGSAAQFMLDLQQLDSLLTDGARLGWDSPELKLKYGRHPRLSQALTMILSGTSVANAVTNLVSALGSAKDLLHLANFGASVPATLGPVLGGILGVGFVGRLSSQAHSSYKRWDTLSAVRAKAERNKGKELHPKTQALLAYAIGSSHRKYETKSVGAVASALSLASSAALGIGALGGVSLHLGTTVAVLTAANCWNPIGWGLSVAAFAVGAGLLGYRLYRKIKKGKLAEKYGFQKEEFSRKLIHRYVKQVYLDSKSHESTVLHAIVQSYGLDVTTALTKPRIAMEAIDRHIQWT